MDDIVGNCRPFLGIKPGDLLWMKLDPDGDEELWDAAIEVVEACIPEGVAIMSTIGVIEMEHLSTEDIVGLRDKLNEILSGR